MSGTSTIGACCTSGESTTNCTSSSTIACSNDATNFPSNTKYNLCSIANTTSWCGLNSDGLEIFDEVDSAIIGIKSWLNNLSLLDSSYYLSYLTLVYLIRNLSKITTFQT